MRFCAAILTSLPNICPLLADVSNATVYGELPMANLP
jgi:hypothetical protein